ncbi:MAG: hypothetical protein SOW55_01025 [Bacilli bacterium]|nr:hypothetical protein [Bacilli bacterium]
MKKRLLTLSMVSLLSLGLFSCSGIKSKKDAEGKQVIVSITADGKEINYTADDLLNQYASTESGVKAYYDAIYDILIRNDQEISQTMKQEVETQMDNFVNTCKTNASTNGTSYKTEQSKSLESEGVNNLGELRELKELAVQKTEYEKGFYSDEKMNEFTTNYIQEKVPYHIRHILVKTDDVSGSSLYDKQISEDESKKIFSVIDRLASGKETFGDIAYDASDDSSNTLYGSVGLMELDTSFVSEFKFNIYYYDVFLSGKNDTGKTREQLLEMYKIPSSVSLGDVTLNTEDVMDGTLKTVSYSTVKMFEDYASTTKTVNNLTYTDEIITDGSVSRKQITDSYYPRNVLFNTYFNNHGLTFITSEGYSNVENNPNWSEPTAELKAVLGNDFNQKILTDNGNPVLVTYNPDTGLHFMIIEKSPINQKYTNYTDYSESSEGKEVALNSLSEELAHYYSLDVPSGSANVTNDNRYVTYLKNNRQGYDDRAKDLESKIKSYDKNISYQLFESLLYDAEGQIRSDVKIDEKILNSILDYINDQRAKTEYTGKEQIVSSWTSYLQLLDFQGIQKKAKQLDFSETKNYFTDTKDL